MEVEVVQEVVQEVEMEAVKAVEAVEDVMEEVRVTGGQLTCSAQTVTGNAVASSTYLQREGTWAVVVVGGRWRRGRRWR